MQNLVLGYKLINIYCCVNLILIFLIISQSFKFDGKVKPLLSGKKKQYGFFALVTPVNPANPFTSTPKELLQLYSCKMGLDLRIRKLDNRYVLCVNSSVNYDFTTVN